MSHFSKQIFRKVLWKYLRIPDLSADRAKRDKEYDEEKCYSSFEQFCELLPMDSGFRPWDAAGAANVLVIGEVGLEAEEATTQSLFPRLVLGWIEADFRVQIRIF